MGKRSGFLALALVAWRPLAAEDEIVFWNGSAIRGEIVSWDSSGVTIRLSGGTVMIGRDLVARVERGAETAWGPGSGGVQDPIALFRRAERLMLQGQPESASPLVSQALRLDTDYAKMTRPRYLVKLLGAGLGFPFVETLVQTGLISLSSAQEPRVQPRRGSRFEDHGDGTVTDGMTGLVWLRDADLCGPVAWLMAQDLVALLNAGRAWGYSDWHLPSEEQLAGMVPLPSGHPFENAQTTWWTGATLANGCVTAVAWNATCYSVDTKRPLSCWLVRGEVSSLPAASEAESENVYAPVADYETIVESAPWCYAFETGCGSWLAPLCWAPYCAACCGFYDRTFCRSPECAWWYRRPCLAAPWCPAPLYSFGGCVVVPPAALVGRSGEPRLDLRSNSTAHRGIVSAGQILHEPMDRPLHRDPPRNDVPGAGPRTRPEVPHLRNVEPGPRTWHSSRESTAHASGWAEAQRSEWRSTASHGGRASALEGSTPSGGIVHSGSGGGGGSSGGGRSEGGAGAHNR